MKIDMSHYTENAEIAYNKISDLFIDDSTLKEFKEDIIDIIIEAMLKSKE